MNDHSRERDDDRDDQHPPQQTHQSAKDAKRRADITVSLCVMVAVALQALAHYRHTLLASPRVQRVADVAVAATTPTRINIVREDGGGPLTRLHGSVADVADILAGVFGVVRGAWVVIIQAKMIYAEVVTTRWAAPGRCEAALRARWDGVGGWLRH